MVDRATWLGKLPKGCAWEHLLHDDVMALTATVQAQRELLRDLCDGDTVTGNDDDPLVVRVWGGSEVARG